MATFTYAAEPPFTALKSRVHPAVSESLGAWRHKVIGRASVVRKGSTVVVLVPCKDSQDLEVTTYYGVEDKTADAILDCVRGKINFHQVFGYFGRKTTWSGGHEVMDVKELVWHLSGI